MKLFSRDSVKKHSCSMVFIIVNIIIIIVTLVRSIYGAGINLNLTAWMFFIFLLSLLSVFVSSAWKIIADKTGKSSNLESDKAKLVEITDVKVTAIFLVISLLYSIFCTALLFEYPVIPILNFVLDRSLKHWQFETWRNIVLSISALFAFGATIWRSKISENQMQEQIKQGGRTERQLKEQVEQGKRTDRQLTLTEKQLRNTENQIELSRQTLAETQTNNLAKLFIDASKILEEAETVSAYRAGLALMRIVYRGGDGHFSIIVIDTLKSFIATKNNFEFTNEAIETLIQILTVMHKGLEKAYSYFYEVVCVFASLIESRKQTDAVSILVKLTKKNDINDFVKSVLDYLEIFLSEVSQLEQGKILNGIYDILMKARSEVFYDSYEMLGTSDEYETIIEKALSLFPLSIKLLEILNQYKLAEPLTSEGIILISDCKTYAGDEFYSGPDEYCYLDYMPLRPFSNIANLSYVKVVFESQSFQSISIARYQECKFKDCQIYNVVKLCSGCKILGSESEPESIKSELYNFCFEESINLVECGRDDGYGEPYRKKIIPEDVIFIENTVFKAEPVGGELFSTEEDKQEFERLHTKKNKRGDSFLKIKNCYYDSALITDQASRDWFKAYDIKPYPEL